MITVEDLSNLGPALKELRQNVRMTQGEVCALAGIKSSQLSRWENGHEKPTLESVLSCHSIPSFWSKCHQPIVVGHRGN